MAGVRRRKVALVIVAAAAFGPLAVAPFASAQTMLQGEAPIVLPTAAPHGDPGGGVVDADTAGGPTAAEGPNPAFLLIAALGVLVGVLVITRPRRRGPD